MGNSKSKICEDSECTDTTHQKRRYRYLFEEIKALGKVLHGQDVCLGYRWKLGPEEKPPFDKWNTCGTPTHIVWEVMLLPAVGISVGPCYSAMRRYKLSSAQFTFWARGTPPIDRERPWCYWTRLRVLLRLREVVVKEMVAKFGQEPTDKTMAKYRSGVKNLDIRGFDLLAECDEKKALVEKF